MLSFNLYFKTDECQAYEKNIYIRSWPPYQEDGIILLNSGAVLSFL